MSKAKVKFAPSGRVAEVETDATILDAARAAGLVIETPCGGVGRCGRCKVVVESGAIEQRQTPHISSCEAESGFVLACATRVKGNVNVYINPVSGAEEASIFDTAVEVEPLKPRTSSWRSEPSVSSAYLGIAPPSLDDNTSDADRVRREMTRAGIVTSAEPSLSLLRTLPSDLRAADWRVAAVTAEGSLIAVRPADQAGRSLGLAVDIGTTTLQAYLVHLATGRIVDSAGSFNAQISRGEDVISRIIYARRENGLRELGDLVRQTTNELIGVFTSHGHETSLIDEIYVAGNTTMTHLFLGIDPKYIREEPYIPAFSTAPRTSAGQLGLAANPNAPVYCFPAVGSYVGGDIVAGVLSSGMFETQGLTLFIDVGTNGEIVLGNADWLISCACSAGPAFEGGGVRRGMRAATGAIDEIWIGRSGGEPGYSVIGGARPKGICGSGLLSALAEMHAAGVLDRAGRFVIDGANRRLRVGASGAEYVVVWAEETDLGEDIALTEADVANLVRAKAAVYAGMSVLLNSVGIAASDIEHVFIAGGFGQHLNVEKAVQIGLLPDLPRDRFRYMGNTSAMGAYAALTCAPLRDVAREIASKMTYVELSADNRFMDEYTSALFLPHTDLSRFPSVPA